MDDEKYLTKDVHEEFARRVHEENERQNLRLTALEKGLQEIGKITISVEKLATSMEGMKDELKAQGKRLEKIEEKPEKRWETIVGGIITGVIGILIGLLSAGVIK